MQLYTVCSCKHKFLEITFQDLSSVTKIIHLLQEDVNFKHDLVTVSIKDTNSIHYLNFEGVNIKPSRKNLISKKWEKNNTVQLQQSQHTAAIVNKYAILYGLQEESEAFQKYCRNSKVALFNNE